VQQDPYQQFASPYVTLGGDPVNMMDPSGGWSISGILGVTKIGVAGVGAIVGALVGGGVGMANGDDRGAAKGAIIGAFAGLAASYGGVGAVVQAVNGITKLLMKNTVSMPTVAQAPVVVGNVGVSGAFSDKELINNDKHQSPTQSISFDVFENKEKVGRVSGTIVKTPGGLSIELFYDNLKSKSTDFDWIQTVTTNCSLDMKLGNYEYNDPLQNDDYNDIEKTEKKPFYWTDSENPTDNYGHGHSARFFDNPARFFQTNPFQVNWSAELSLVGLNLTTMKYQSMINLRYGFTINIGGVVRINSVTISPVSSFQKKSISSAKPRLPRLIKILLVWLKLFKKK
jgi:hypothetical protein